MFLFANANGIGNVVHQCGIVEEFKDWRTFARSHSGGEWAIETPKRASVLSYLDLFIFKAPYPFQSILGFIQLLASHFRRT